MRKKLLLVAALLCFVFGQKANAQATKELNHIQDISFYGVDFSFAKIYGSDDSYQNLTEAFARINDLFESEPQKYDMSKALGISRVYLYNSEAKSNAKNISESDLFAENNSYVLSDEDIANAIAQLKKEGDSQFGAIILTGLLNKTSNRGTFTYVIFDQQTNQIIFQKELTGKAKGFGLRNFWAGALYSTMKKMK